MAGVSVRLEVNEAALSREVQRHGRRVAARWQRRTATQARQDAPVRTGHLGRSVGEGDVKTVGPFTVTGSVHARADYALYVHEGTRPHVIRPRRAKALRFEVGGRVVFAKMVRHPGVRARPFLRNAGVRVARRMAAES